MGKGFYCIWCLKECPENTPRCSPCGGPVIEIEKEKLERVVAFAKELSQDPEMLKLLADEMPDEVKGEDWFQKDIVHNLTKFILNHQDLLERKGIRI